MRRAFTVILAISIGILAYAAQAEFQSPVAHQTDRILPKLKDIETRVLRVNSLRSDEEKIAALDSEGLRDSLRDLQNLFRIYGEKKKRYPKFKEYSDMMKEFEDFISHYRDLQSFRRSTSYERAEIRNKYEKAYQEGRAKYQAFVNTSPWFTIPGGRIDETREYMKNFDWPSLRKDRDDLLEGIAVILKDYHKKEYDMSLTEEGIHELRRDARRPSYLDYAAGNIIDSAYELACPIGLEVEKDERKSASAFYCRVPSCLKEKLSSASSGLSSLKAEALNYELRGDHLPSSIVRRGEQYRDELKSSKVFLHIANAIQSCREPNEIFERE